MTGNKLLLLAFFGLSFALVAAAQPIERWQFEEPEQQELFEQLLHEFACPQCFGASLAESPAMVAEDIRQIVRQQVLEGKSAAQIRTWMIARYGPSITTVPTGNSALLWLLPPLLLLATLVLCRYYLFR